MKLKNQDKSPVSIKELNELQLRDDLDDSIKAGPSAENDFASPMNNLSRKSPNTASIILEEKKLPHQRKRLELRNFHLVQKRSHQAIGQRLHQKLM